MRESSPGTSLRQLFAGVQALRQRLVGMADPLAIIDYGYNKLNPGAFATHTNRLIEALYKLNPDKTLNEERKVIEHWTGTSTSGKSLGILAREPYLKSRPLYQRHQELGYPKPVISYTHIMTDIITARRMGLITSPQGAISPQEYQDTAEVTDLIRYLSLRYLPGPDNQGRPHLHIEDTVSITALCHRGALRGVERGGLAGLRFLIANGWEVFTVAVNMPERKKNEVMMLREVIPTLPDDQVISYLREHDVEDPRTDVSEIKDSYIYCGDAKTRDQQYNAIAENMFYLIQEGKMADDLNRRMSLAQWKEFLKNNPDMWEKLLDEYIIVWEELLYTQKRPKRAIFLRAAELPRGMKRWEPRDWFKEHDALTLLSEQARITGNSELRAHLRYLKIDLRRLKRKPIP